MDVAADPPLGRCAAHPARPAHDDCPCCGRPRCSADARDLADRCRVCRQRTVRVRRPLEALTGAGAVGVLLAVVGAAIGQEYVGARVFSWLFPALVGVVIAVGALAWTGPLLPAWRGANAAGCALLAAISALLDFRFTHEPFGPAGRWLPPLLAAAAAGAAAAWALARPGGGSGGRRGRAG